MTIRPALPLAAALPLSLALLKFAPAPFIWISAAIAGALLYAVATARATWVRLACLTAATMVLVFGAAEAALRLWGRPVTDLVITPAAYYESDSLLGWRLRPGSVLHAVEHAGGTPVFDVTYTIDSSGHRVTPAGGGGAGEPCVLFFADSFTFGWGLADGETLPYRVGERLRGEARVINFGTPAYGAEHMLAALENGLVERDTRCRPTHIIYQAMPHHVLRAARKAGIARFNPRFALDAEGAVRYTGTVPRGATGPAPESFASRVVHDQLRKSRVYAALRAREAAPTADDFRLYLAIVRRSRRLFAELYPDAEFHVLLWMHRRLSAGGDLLRDSLPAVTPDVHLVDDILPDYETRPARYEIGPGDVHPNALANELLASYVVDSIIRRPPRSRQDRTP